MTTEEAFKDACKRAKLIKQDIPIDVRLRFYALYKQGTTEAVSPFFMGSDIRDAFKMNARIQVSHLSQEEAQKAYIKLVNKYVPPTKK